MNNLLRTAVLCGAVIAISSTAVANEADESYLKDLDIRQTPMHDVLVPPAPASAGNGLAVDAEVDRSSRVYTHGDHVVLSVTTTEDSYIWVFDTGTSGKVHQLFPNRYDQDNFLNAGSTLSIPPADAEYVLSASHPQGAELITVVATKENTPLTPDLVDWDSDIGPFLALRGTADSVAKDLAITLRDQNAPWAKDKVVIVIE